MQDLLKCYENNSIWINDIILGLITIFVGLYVSQKIEKYKHNNNKELSLINSELSTISKRTEINYKENFESQIKAIKQLYEKYVTLEYSTNLLIEEKFINNPHDELKVRIINWRKYLFDIHSFYNRNRIIFSERLDIEFNTHIIDFEIINRILHSEYQELIQLEEHCNEDKNEMYTSEYEQYESIILKIKRLKNKDEFKRIDLTFNTFKMLMKKEYNYLIK